MFIKKKISAIATLIKKFWATTILLIKKKLSKHFQVVPRSYKTLAEKKRTLIKNIESLVFEIRSEYL